MPNRLTYIIAGALILTLFWTAFLSMKQDSLTFDELAHIPAGYSYLTQKDYRINPEHPPLIKDLAALPLLFLNLNFPAKDHLWLQENSAPPWWVQFDLGTKFLYESGNNPREIILWSRFPIILLLISLGLFLFKWARELGGNYAGLAVLALFSFSPEFIANGRLVTTDVGAAFGAALAAYFWLKFLKEPKNLNVLWAGVFLGVALLIKFSLVLLLPFFAIITLIYALNSDQKMANLKKYIFKFIIAGAVSLFVIWPVYQIHIWNYPIEHQVRDTIADISDNDIAPLKNLTIWMAGNPILRPVAQFFRGILMATHRTASGNTVYFLGQISASGWRYYFPVIYLLKVPLAFHIITLLTIIATVILAIKRKLAFDIKKHFTLLSFFTFLAIYWLTAINGKLNIGIRHLLPTFPFIYLLAVLILKEIMAKLPPSIKRASFVLICSLLAWYAFSSLSSFPYYISYFNQLAGGTKNGYKYAVDSNYDWGQDFYRFIDFVKKNNIQKISLDYFGGENPKYWLGDKYIKLNPREISGNLPEGFVAVSVNQLMGGVAKPVSGFDQQTGYYRWLDEYDLRAKAGNSIFIYYKKEK
ncbi:MAG: glycosyltransferase family 39 protein [Candidatus Nealsonbacteria bacterium]|nr:glycosyltransferase family 39 protein [Candidatus Nealsonbacteria bacterium]